jgi:hypothetical protein
MLYTASQRTGVALTSFFIKEEQFFLSFYEIEIPASQEATRTKHCKETH